MKRDPIVAARWQELFAVLDPHGLVATWLPAEDETVDDCIEIRAEGSSEDLGDLQLGQDGAWMACVWTDSDQQARTHGCLRNDIVDAAMDLISLLKRHNRIASQ